jgi:hypothetical protein
VPVDPADDAESAVDDQRVGRHLVLGMQRVQRVTPAYLPVQL